MQPYNSKENLVRLMETYQNLVFSICLRLTGDYFIAEDITQDTFLSAYQHWQVFDGTNEKAWICRIATNKCIDWQRTANRRTTLTVQEDMLDQEIDKQQQPLQQVLAVEVMEELKRKCVSLPEPYQMVATAHFLENRTAQEIADKTGDNLKTVQTRIYRARDMLKKQIRREDLLS